VLVIVLVIVIVMDRFERDFDREHEGNALT
jgi:hypothetical protein